MDPIHVQRRVNRLAYAAHCQFLQRVPANLRGENELLSWDVILESDLSRAIAGMSELRAFVHLPVVNNSLSIEVPYTGRFWQHNTMMYTTKNNKRESLDELRRVTTTRNSLCLSSDDRRRCIAQR